MKKRPDYVLIYSDMGRGQRTFLTTARPAVRSHAERMTRRSSRNAATLLCTHGNAVTRSRMVLFPRTFNRRHVDFVAGRTQL